MKRRMARIRVTGFSTNRNRGMLTNRRDWDLPLSFTSVQHERTQERKKETRYTKNKETTKTVRTKTKQNRQTTTTKKNET